MEASLAPYKSSILTLPNFDRFVRGCLLLYIISLPFKDLLFIERNGFLMLLVLLALWCVLNRRLFFVQTPIDIPLVAFIFWVCMTIPFATYPLYSLQEFGKLLQQGLLFYVVLFFFREKSRWNQLIWILVGVCLIVSLYGILQFDPAYWLAVKSFMPAEVWLVTYLIMMIPFSFALAWYEERPWAKRLYGLTALLSTSCLLLTQSRAGILAFFVELWACAWFLKRRTMLALASGMTALMLIVAVCLVKVVKENDGAVHLVPRVAIALKTETASVVHRLDIWAFMIQRLAEHPIAGIGYGKETTKMLYGQVPEKNLPWGHFPVRIHGTHNLLIELALLVGLPGMLLFIWLAVRLARTVFNGYQQTDDIQARAILLGIGVGMIGMGVRVMFDQMLVGTLAIQFWILVAIAIAASGAHGTSSVSESQSRGVLTPASRDSLD